MKRPATSREKQMFAMWKRDCDIRKWKSEIKRYFQQKDQINKSLRVKKK